MLEVAALDDEGRGVATHDARSVHVPGALPGERAEVIIEHASAHRAESFGRLVALASSSSERVAPVCPATGRCGGCPLGILSYDAQLAYKQRRLETLLESVFVSVEGMTPSPRATAYRCQSKMVYGRTRHGKHPCLGAYAPRSHAVVDLAGCKVVEPVLDEVRGALLAALLERNVTPYDEVEHDGVLSYVVLRANAEGEVLATFVGPDIAALASLAPLIDVHPAIVGIAANQRPLGNAIFGRTTSALAGRAELEERVGAILIRLSPTAFFQVNRGIAAAMYAEIARALVTTKHGLVVDAYAGVGGIALTLAHAGAEVVGVEVNAAAVADAQRAALAQSLSARFMVDDAARGLATIAKTSLVDAVVVNPPRRGLDRAMLDALVVAKPARLAYVSCDPQTLVRDLHALGAQGLRPFRIRGFDMHPQTPHIETLALLTRE